MRRILGILGTPIDDLDNAQAMQRLSEFIESGRFHQVATANTDFLIKALHDPELSHILRQADLVVPDGMPVVLASRLLGAPLKERVTGADMVPALAKAAAERGWRIYMLGAKPEVAAAAKAKLERDNPGLQIVGCFSPPLAPIIEMDNAAILADIERTEPHILLVAFGNPKQEKWIHMHREQLRVPVCIGIGGTFDFISGNISRAPQWVQTIGMEWAYRLLQEPKRLWRRYSQDFVHFGRFFALQWLSGRAAANGRGRILTASVGTVEVITVEGVLNDPLNQQFQQTCDTAMQAGRSIILDLAACPRFGVAAVGTLINLPKRADFAGIEVLIVRPSASILRTLKHAKVLHLYNVYGSIAESLQAACGKRFEISTETGAEGVIVRLIGHADVTGLQTLRSALAGVENSKVVTVDLSDADYVDSAVLTEIRRAADACSEFGGRLQLIHGPASRAKLELEGLSTRFHIAEAKQTADPSAVTSSAARRVA